MSFLNFLFDAVSDLGKMPKLIITALFKKLIKLVTGLLKFIRESFSSAGAFFKRAIVGVLVVALLSGIIYIAASNSNRVDAICIKVGDKTVGFVNSQTEADAAKAYALKILGTKDFALINESQVKVQAHKLKTATSISDRIINELGEDLIPVYEVYIDNEFIGAVVDGQKARESIDGIYSLAQKLYPNATASFSQSIKLIQTQYPADSQKILSQSELETTLSNKVKILYAQCEKTYAATPFETVEVQTNKLFMGDSRIRRAGVNGTEYNINLVAYIDNQKAYSSKLMSFDVQPPVTQIVERGIRSTSLSMGSYTVFQTTGMFCWPVVDLYVVTSPYGSRSLGYHRGIDISGANASGKLVVAGASGTVTEAGWSTGGYGNYVKISHGNGVETLYAHMLDDSLMVNVGDVVQKGQTIGRVGNTGYSFGAHLHFEVRVNGNRLDPAPFLGLQ
ncbi:MAG: peptidoglycan DD-metalloendopeptidase family protein [Clostridia bacterium]|nr:peptidoglycan DD-metalloendopeptidase family protein [Clostridia bacterium]